MESEHPHPINEDRYPVSIRVGARLDYWLPRGSRRRSAAKALAIGGTVSVAAPEILTAEADYVECAFDEPGSFEHLGECIEDFYDDLGEMRTKS